MMYLPYHCQIDYIPSAHLTQLYAGFEQLNKKGIIKLIVKKGNGNPYKPLLTVTLENKIRIIYDELDGLNWIDGTIEENLEYFKKNIKADFYFKRSFNKQIEENKPAGCEVLPLGLNYPISTFNFQPKFTKETVRNYLGYNKLIRKIFKIERNPFINDFEFPPLPCRENKILFLTRLWNPEEVSISRLKSERENINNFRVRCIKACKSEFKDLFIGGLQKEPFAEKYYKEFTVLPYLSNRRNFLKTIRKVNICIATTGLHNSIGWKFGEYIAASRAVLSEPLYYQVPGDFKENKNYFTFSDENELIDKINILANNRNALIEMMINNYHYYNNYLRPDQIVLNSLLAISKFYS